MDWSSDIVSVLLLILGAIFGISAKKRKYERTNALGIERFASFWAMVRGRTGDFALTGIAICLLSLGTLLSAANHLETWGWVVVAPVCLFILYLLLGL